MSEFVRIIDYTLWEYFVDLYFHGNRALLSYKYDGDKTVVSMPGYSMDYDGPPEPHFLFPLMGRTPCYKTNHNDYCVLEDDERYQLSDRLVTFIYGNQVQFSLEWAECLPRDIVNVDDMTYPIDVRGVIHGATEAPAISNQCGVSTHGYVELVVPSEEDKCVDYMHIDNDVFNIVANHAEADGGEYNLYNEPYNDMTVNDYENETRIKALDTYTKSLVVYDSDVDDCIWPMQTGAKNALVVSVKQITVEFLEDNQGAFDYVFLGDALCNSKFEYSMYRDGLVRTLKDTGQLIGIRRGVDWPVIQTGSLVMQKYVWWENRYQTSYKASPSHICQLWESSGFVQYRPGEGRYQALLFDVVLYDQFVVTKEPSPIMYHDIEGDQVSMYPVRVAPRLPDCFVGVRHPKTHTVPVLGSVGILYKQQNKIYFYNVETKTVSDVSGGYSLYAAVEGRHILVSAYESVDEDLRFENKLQYLDSRGPDLPQSWSARKSVVCGPNPPFSTGYHGWHSDSVYYAPVKSQGGFGVLGKANWKYVLRDVIDMLVYVILRGDLALTYSDTGVWDPHDSRWALIGTVMRVKKRYRLSFPVETAVLDIHISKAHGRSMPLLEAACEVVFNDLVVDDQHSNSYPAPMWNGPKRGLVPVWFRLYDGQRGNGKSE